jgi:hypothetical protein
MTDIKIFKEIASKKLPEYLFEELEPHLESLLKAISGAENEAREYEYHIKEVNRERYRSLQDEFAETMKPLWPAFARERWPEIDKYYNFEPVVSPEGALLPCQLENNA